jgi:branched-chain amino acid transport system substrate-binding protein
LRRCLFFLAVPLIILCGCRETDVTTSTAEQLADRARSSLESGNYQTAVDLYEEALLEDPDHPDASEWLRGEASAFLALKRYDEAVRAAQKAAAQARDDSDRNSAILLQAEIELQESSYLACSRSLAALDTEQLGRDRMERAEEIALECTANLQTDRLVDIREQGWLELFVLLELEKRYYYQGDLERAAMVGNELDRLYPDAHQRFGRPELQEVENTYVALVLPLTGGEASTYAKVAREGALLAFERAQDTRPGVPELIVMDTGSSDRKLLSITATLVEDPRCLGIIGPLTSSSTFLVADQVRRHHLPLITPTATSGEIDRYDSYVHRLSVGGTREVACMAEYAVRTAGCLRLSVLHAYTSESANMAQTFVELVEEMGGEVLIMEGYEPGTTDFRDQIRAIKTTRPDGIYLPVTAWDAVQIAPQLRFYQVDVELFGSSGWDDEMTPRLGGEYVEDAVFPVGTGSGSLYPPAARFTYYYQRKYGEDPSTVARQAYDAAGIFLKAWNTGGDDREAIERALQGIRVYHGATGTCSLGSVEFPRTSCPLLTIKEGEIISIE